MTARIHVLLPEADKARYRMQAQREGMSLGAWLREAAEERYRAAASQPDLRSREALEDFFALCDERGEGREPDWEEWKRLMAESRTRGMDVT